MNELSKLPSGNEINVSVYLNKQEMTDAKEVDEDLYSFEFKICDVDYGASENKTWLEVELI